MPDSNSATPKTPITNVSSNSNKFEKFFQKIALTFIKGIFEDFDNSRIFTKMQHPYVKFDRKHDGAEHDLEQPTVLELCKDFVQKLGTFELGDPKAAYNLCFHKILPIPLIDLKKWPSYSKGIFEDLNISKIFANVQHPYVIFDGKYDEAVPEPVRLVLELCKTFVQKLCPGT